MRRALKRLGAGLLPPHERESVLGDLAEEDVRAGSWSWIRALLGVALCYQLEGWRDDKGRVGAAISLTLGLALWSAFLAAGDWPAELEPLYRDPLSRSAIRFWDASHLPAALAVGLLVGHAPWVPKIAMATRWHVTTVLAVLAGVTAPAGDGVLTAALLVATAWLGGQRADGASSHTT